MNKKELTSKEKVENLKKNSKAALEVKRNQILNSQEIQPLEKKKKNTKEENSLLYSFEKKMVHFSTSFTEKDLLFQICIVVPIILILLAICNRLLFSS